MFSVLYLPPNLYPIGIARWLKAEFLHCSRIGGSVILVDLLSGCGVGVGEVGSWEGIKLVMASVVCLGWDHKRCSVFPWCMGEGVRDVT